MYIFFLFSIQENTVNKESISDDSLPTTADNVTTQLNELEIKDPEDEGWTVVSRKHKSTSTNH